ncbi:Uncharacterised protein [Salmonella enterica subsp. enterica]|uniref:Uncharacterized protein n=1 Tax=Salmonella enterica I TaxID=59201 RepID=A0A3S4IHU9_SALET|nr:Uncharacterised protein [Salmonella enterica subsp. enterica]
MLPISPVPLKVGVVSFVAPLLPMLPITGATLSLISGASGCAGGLGIKGNGENAGGRATIACGIRGGGRQDV